MVRARKGRLPEMTASMSCSCHLLTAVSGLLSALPKPAHDADYRCYIKFRNWTNLRDCQGFFYLVNFKGRPAMRQTFTTFVNAPVFALFHYCSGWYIHLKWLKQKSIVLCQIYALQWNLKLGWNEITWYMTGALCIQWHLCFFLAFWPAFDVVLV